MVSNNIRIWLYIQSFKNFGYLVLLSLSFSQNILSDSKSLFGRVDSTQCKEDKLPATNRSTLSGNGGTARIAAISLTGWMWL